MNYFLFVACIALLLLVLGTGNPNPLRAEIVTKERALWWLQVREWLASKIFRLAMWVGGIEVKEDGWLDDEQP